MKSFTSRFKFSGVMSWVKFAPAFLLLLATFANAQSTGTVTGTVTDQSGAVVSKAKITLHNEGTGDDRETTSNDSGYFSFGTVNPGTYTVKVAASNFKSLERKGVAVRVGDVRNISDLALQVGTSNDVIEVTSVADEIAPVDSGERSAVLTSKQIQNLALEGRDATELIRTLPGFAAFNGGSVLNSAQDFTVISPTGGAVGQGYSGNGAPYRGGTDLTMDGAHIIDNGCNCGATTTVNGDMVSEVKVQTSNFGADSAKGPVVVNATGKSGTTSYHGEVYLHARDQSLNSLDWAFKHQMIANNRTNPIKIQPAASRFLYPGAQIGGPVPGTNKKLVFHTAFEYYYQNQLPANGGESIPGLITGTVPTASMRQGIFDIAAADNTAFCTSGGNSSAPVCTTMYNTGSTAIDGIAPGASNFGWVDNNGVVNNGGPGAGTSTSIPVSSFDPGAAILLANIPTPNADPTATGGFNYIHPVSQNQNGWMWRTRADYNLSENTKIYATYQEQKETDNVPIHLWWQPTNSIPFPGGMSSKDNSQTISGHFVKIINPTLTNDLSTGLGYINYPLTRNSKSAWAASSGGVAGTPYPYSDGPYPSTSLMMPQIGNGYWLTGVPQMIQPDIFTNGGHFVWQKWNYSIEDNLTKSFKTHTIKGGFYYERTTNNQGAFTDYNGNFQPSVVTWNNSPLQNCYDGTQVCGSNNPVANLLLGTGGFDQVNKSALDNLWYPTYSGYVQDDWKATRRLTLNLGLRADHLGPWTPPNKFGVATWTGNLNTPTIPGVTWRGETPSIPLAGRKVPTITWEPRLGLAYDLRGNGKTVLRGGWGEYGYRDQWNDYAGPADLAQGVLSYNGSGFPVSLAYVNSLLGTLPTTGGCGAALGTVCGNTTVELLSDNKQPLSRNYNFTISQQLPWSSLLEVGYVGSESLYGNLEGNSGALDEKNLNVIPIGAMFALTGCAPLQASNPGGSTGGGCSQNVPNTLYPYNSNYGTSDLAVLRHLAKTNYNALQVSWARQKGRINYNLNYTWSKALGTQGTGQLNGLAPDATNLAHDYGVLSIDRSHVINLSYVVQSGSPFKNRALGYVANGWNLSGITTWQSGPDMTTLTSTNLGLNGTGPSWQDPLNGGVFGTYGISNTAFIGTPNANVQPTVICDPTAHLKAHQYFNANCFSGPNPGTNGLWQLPYLHGPAFFNSDLALYKTIKVTERQNVEFRLSAFNFLNHPLDSLQGGADSRLTMAYSCNGAPASSTNYCPNGSGSYVVQNAPTGNFVLDGNNVATGYASTKLGRRVLELSAKYSF